MREECACRSSPPGRKQARRTPFRKRLPIAAGAIQSQQAAVQDLFPTILSLTETAIPSGHTVDGQKLNTLLTGKADSRRSETFLMHHRTHRIAATTGRATALANGKSFTTTSPALSPSSHIINSSISKPTRSSKTTWRRRILTTSAA